MQISAQDQDPGEGKVIFQGFQGTLSYGLGTQKDVDLTPNVYPVHTCQGWL